MKKQIRIASRATLGLLALWSVQILVAAPAMNSGEAESALRLGNDRFVKGELSYPNQGAERRAALAKGQNPFATVIACSDSRVSPEFLFDQGIGDLFVVRVAGNVADVDEVGSIEYGIEHLYTPLLVVLGHTHCGAVTAVAKGQEVHGSIPRLVDNIAPAVSRVKIRGLDASSNRFVATAVEENVWVTIEDLIARSADARALLKAGSLRIVGAVYDIETGAVQWMGEHPKQAALVESAKLITGFGGGHSASGSKHAEDLEHVAVDLSVLDIKPFQTHFLFWILVGLGGVVVSAGSILYAAKVLLPKWKVSRRLGAGFAGMIALVVLAGAIGFDGMFIAVKDFEKYRAEGRRTILLAEIDIAFLEAEIAIRDFAQNHSEESLAILHEEIEAFYKVMEHVPRFFEDKEQLAALEGVSERVAGFESLLSEVEGSSSLGQAEAAILAMEQIGAEVDHTLLELTNSVISEQTESEPGLLEELYEAKTMVVVVSVAAVFIGMMLSWVISRSIVIPLSEISDTLDLGAEQTSSAATEVSATSQSLAEGASEQAASVEEASASLEEIDSIIGTSADNFEQVEELLRDVQKVVTEGVEHMSSMSKAMDDIKIASNEIGTIMGIIDDIAFQTNILALNASVEAARAGEAGRGFAVVAEEVRRLAGRSAEATSRTAGQIKNAIGKTDVGVQMTDRLGESLKSIVGSIDEVTTKLDHLGQSAREQRVGVSQLNIAVRQIDTVSQQNASNSEETAAAAEELSGQAEMLRASVNQLREMISGVASKRIAPETDFDLPDRSRHNGRNRVADQEFVSF